MADKETQSNDQITNSFTKGMVKDYNDTFVGEGMWTHARNSVNNSHTGQIGVLGNEPSNLHCVTLPYTLIGCIHLYEDQWAVFTTNNNDCEIGIFDESDCTYEKRVNDQCLNFKTSHLITGAFRERYDCERLVYFEDGLNPSRVLDLDRIPYVKTKKIVNDCVVETSTDVLDCEAIRLASLLTYPCIILNKSRSAGTLPNGSYQVVICYTINQTKVSDYIGLTEVQSLFSHENVNGALDVKITAIDKTFDEFELVLLSNINAQTTAKRIGYYSTNISSIIIDRIDAEAINVPVSDIILRTEPIEKADAMYTVGDYLLRVGVYSKFRFNYQPQANDIKVFWKAVQYPSSYYHDGGNNTGYMRDEQYAFFIRWIYNTGDRSDSYHIPGRIASGPDNDYYTGDDAYETASGVRVKKWQVQNTALLSNNTEYTIPDGGKVILTGQMGYWESTERYPDNKPEIWGKLCGKPIRHHKIPDETVDDRLKMYSKDTDTITIIGVEFQNITPPLDVNGNPIQSIVGYEILRGSREGNKSIISKGLVNNMRESPIPNSPTMTGLYQNYPYNDLRPDDYLTSVEQTGENAQSNPNALPKLSGYRKDIFSFHGPEVTFNNPYLDAAELKIYQETYGQSNGYFTIPYKHPRFKIPGKGIKIIADVLAVLQTLAGIIGGVAGADGTLMLQGTSDIPLTSDLLAKHRQDAISSIPLVIAGASTSNPWYFGTTGEPISSVSASVKRTTANSAITTANIALLALMSPLTFKVQQQQLYAILTGFIPKRQYAAQYLSHGVFDEFADNPEGNRRRRILDSKYVGGAVQGFNNSYQINNLNRGKMVVIKTEGEYDNPTNVDNSRFTLQRNGYTLNRNITSNISARYGALKIPIPSQYGQLDSIKQLAISSCVEPTLPIKGMKYTSSVLFGGDVYINRFTEKNTMCFFETWLMGEPDLFELNYCLYSNISYPRYWLNTSQNHSEFITSAAKYKSLDGEVAKTFYISRGFFYLFNSGVRDFYVESEINTAYRDWDEQPSRRHYDPYRYTDLNMMFRSDLIRDSNFYKYDYSLSITKLFNSYITWGSMLPRDYDPTTTSTCFTYRPTRVIHSLPIQYQSKKDNWRAFLSNNYTDFVSPVTSIKPINMTGALFMMKSQSPLKFLGVEELKLDSTGAKIKIGDGGLFAQDNQLQSLVNADESYEYGSCQNRYAVAGTKHGVFWVSQNQGKVFQYSGGLNEISDTGMKWWFAKYLPSQLLNKFPSYPHYDNPVIGIGVQMIYDNANEIIYITKKDYAPTDDVISYDETLDAFNLKNGQTAPLTDFRYFQDASFTISYDVKTKVWVSFHDWIPTFLLPGKNHFMSVNTNSIWKHNVRCDSYCNFYGVDYPWEVEFVSSTGQQVTTTRSIEYLLEAYKYYNDCRDKFHVLDRNFDQAILYNSEQVSGLLQLNLKPKNNPIGLLEYPAVRTDYIDILFAKEENKYRFNQFWDVTKDRSEFMAPNSPDPANIPMFITEPNGYKFVINPDYINYNKSPLQRKKFRHHVNRVFLKRNTSDNIKFLFKLSNQKVQPSYR